MATFRFFLEIVSLKKQSLRNAYLRLCSGKFRIWEYFNGEKLKKERENIMYEKFCMYFDDYALKTRIGPIFVALLPFVFYISFEFKILNNKEYILIFIGGILALFFYLEKL